MNARQLLPRLAIALVLLALATAAWFNRDQINLAAFDAWLGSVGPWAPVVYVILYAIGTVAFVPGMIFALAGGALFGPFLGSIWNLAGATLGATFAFIVARYIAGDWVARKAGGLLKLAIAGIDAEGWRFVAFVRLVPLFPFNLSNYVLGLHAHSASPLRARYTHLHGARYDRLHMAGPCGTWCVDGRSGRRALWLARSRTARGHRVAAAIDKTPASRRSMSCCIDSAFEERRPKTHFRHMNVQHIYLDYNASTPIDPTVVAAMRPFFEGHYGNPSSGHWAATTAKAALETARGQVAALLNCRNDEIVFTSGGSEANNLALKGAFFALRNRGNHIVTTQIEHPAIIEPCKFLEQLGAQVTYLPVDGTGRLNPDDLRNAITPRTILVSIMHANNEVGTVQPIDECALIAHAHGALFHTDAAQSVGKISTTVRDLGADLLSIAGHKVYAPKGIGALFVRQGVSLEPLVHGAGHESGRRAGTESAVLAVGLGAACELARDLAPMTRVRSLRDRFWQALRAIFGNRIILNGHPTHRLPNTLNVSFVGQIGAEVLKRLDGVAASTGSACHSGRIELSPILKAMGTTPEVGMGAVRFSLGRATTAAEIDEVVGRTAGLPVVTGSA